jgi:hypothetical protein
MKTIKQQIETLALILSMLILLQGCTVYKSASVTLDDAVNQELKTKIVTKSGEKLKFSRIGLEDGEYYGMHKDNHMMFKIPIDKKYVKSIKIKDKTLSTILTLGLPVVIIFSGLVIMAGSYGYL